MNIGNNTEKVKILEEAGFKLSFCVPSSGGYICGLDTVNIKEIGYYKNYSGIDVFIQKEIINMIDEDELKKMIIKIKTIEKWQKARGSDYV